MANDHDVPLGGAQEPGAREGADEHAREDVPLTGIHVSSELAVRRPQGTAAVWRNRALALRSVVPELARNPVVVGASAAAATVALRLAVDVARRALGAPAQPAKVRSVDLRVTGSVLHHVHVIQHVHVIHHRSSADPLWPLPPPRS